MENTKGAVATSIAAGILADIRSRLDADDTLFGERLMVLGPLATPIGGPGLVALDGTGTTVLIAPLAPPTRSTASRLAEEMDRLGESSPAELKRHAGIPREGPSVQEQHRSSFESPEPAEINHAQKLIVVLAEEPTPEFWGILQDELGTQLTDVYVHDGGSLTPLTPPAVAPVPPAAPRRAPSEQKNIIAGLSLGSLLGIGALLLGVGLVVAGIAAALRGGEESEAPVETFVQVPIRTVASGVSSTATFTQWAGQQRVVRVGGDRLLVLYLGEQGLEIVADERNQGRTWRSAVRVPQVSGDSFSVAADGRGRLHLILSDEGTMSYVLLTRTGSGYKPGEFLELSDSATQVGNIAWEPQTGTAQAVWVEETSEGEWANWAAITPAGGVPSVLEEEQLAEAGSESDALVNVGAFGDGRVIAAYRNAADSSWYSKVASVDDLGAFEWEPEERLPTKDFAGAVSLVVDDEKNVHLALRDDGNARILYFRRADARGWSSGETAVEAASSEEIELPSIAIDTTSRLVYVFFVDTSAAKGDLQVAIRDPATGWEGPDGVAGEGELDEGALYPTTMGRSEGQPTLIWTTQGEEPAIQSARISAP